MAFGLGKLAVLESKLDIYEDLSKEMLDKLERAVDKISESNQQVALILQRHEDRLEKSDRADEVILKMLEEVKISNTKEHSAVISRIEKVEGKVADLAKFRWMTAGVVGALMVILQAPVIFSNILTPSIQTGNIERAK